MLQSKSEKCPTSSATTASSNSTNQQKRHAQVWKKFNEDIFKRNVLTDAECIVEGQVFKTHRAILVCFSPYLKKKLVSPEGKSIANRIQIPKIGSKEFEILLQYMYSGNLKIDCNSLLDVYKAASLLEMDDAKTECLQIIDGRDEISTYFYTYVLSKKLGTQQNWQRALKLITHRFEESVFSKEFMLLDLNFVIEILSAQSVGARSETIVFLAALNWLNHDYFDRSWHAVTVMKCVRFSSMTLEEIIACFHPPFLSQVVQNPEVMEMLFRATCYIAAKMERQDTWFKEFASPKRNLSLESLSMELWHKKLPSSNSPESEPTKKQRNLVDVIAGNTGQENEHMENVTFIQTMNQVFRNESDLENLNEFELNDEYDSAGGQTGNISSNKRRGNLQKTSSIFEYNFRKCKPFQLSRSTSNCNDIKCTSTESTKIVHLRKGPQKFPDTGQKSKDADQRNLQVIRAKVEKVPESNNQNISRIVDFKPKEKKSILFPSITDLLVSNERKGFLKDKDVRTVQASPSLVIYADNGEVKPRQTRIPILSSKVSSSISGTKESSCILVIGGMDPKNLNTKEGGEVLILDSKAKSWALYSNLPEPRHNHCAAYLNNCLYITGGCHSEETMTKNQYVAKRSCFKLDLKKMTWKTISDMKCCRFDHGVAVHDGKLYAIGGQGEDGSFLKSVEVYDPKRNRWKLLPSDMCCGRKAMGVVTYSDRIWIVGGLIQPSISGKLQPVSHVDCYHPEEKKWHFNLYSLPGPRCFCSLAVYEEKLYCIGGTFRAVDRENMRASNLCTDEVWFIDSENELWKKAPSLPQPRMGGVAVVFNGSLFYLGGFDPRSDSTDKCIYFLKRGATSWNIGPALPSLLHGLSAICPLSYSS